MKVILLEDIRGIGKKHDVKDVKDGYARNFLFPNNLAKAATPGEMKKMEEMRSRMSDDEAKLKKHLEKLALKINETTLEIKVKTDESGSIFGSVSKESILKGMRDVGLVTKERVSVELEYPIKKTGEHELSVRLAHGVEAKLKVKVVREE